MAKKVESLYVGIPNAGEVRRDLLFSSKDLLQGLKSYEHIKDIRTKKIEAMYTYHKTLEEIQTLMRKLRRAIPSAPPAKKAALREEVKEENTEKRERKAITEEMNTLKQLERGLDAIEQKLGRLEQ